MDATGRHTYRKMRKYVLQTYNTPSFVGRYEERNPKMKHKATIDVWKIVTQNKKSKCKREV